MSSEHPPAGWVSLGGVVTLVAALFLVDGLRFQTALQVLEYGGSGRYARLLRAAKPRYNPTWK